MPNVSAKLHKKRIAKFITYQYNVSCKLSSSACCKIHESEQVFKQKECNMRGIETGKVRIRHEVFTEIARNGL